MQPLAPEASYGLSAGVVWLGLLHSVWIGFAVAASVALVFQTRRPLSHRQRHAIALASLALVVLASPILAVVQHLAPPRLSPGVPARATTVVVRPGPSRSQPPGVSDAPEPARPAAGSHVDRCLQPLAAVLPHVAAGLRAVRPIGLTAWSLAVAGLGAVLALGVRGVSRLGREAAVAPAPVQERARRLGRRLRLGKVPAVWVHPRLGEPCLCGAFRPAILLPVHWLAAADDAAIDAVLAHELAHARRLDHLVNLAQRLVETLLFFHPGVHWLSRTLRRHREFCADGLAVRLTRDPLALATALESVARLRVARPSVSPRVAALGGEAVSLLPRIQELIGMTPLPSPPRLWPFVVLVLAPGLAVMAFSASLAQETAARPPSAATAPAPLPAPPPSGTDRDRPVAIFYDCSPPGQLPPSNTVRDLDRQMSYEVRFIDLRKGTWRDSMVGQATPLGSGAGTHGWVISHDAMNDLIRRLASDPVMNLLQAPKVTSFEGVPVVMVNGPGETSAMAGDKAEKLISGEGVREGTWMHFNGTSSPRGTKLSVSLHDSWTARPDGKVRYAGSCDLIAGSSLLVDLGCRERRVGERSVMGERLVIITPRLIVLVPEPPVTATAPHHGPPH